MLVCLRRGSYLASTSDCRTHSPHAVWRDLTLGNREEVDILWSSTRGMDMPVRCCAPFIDPSRGEPGRATRLSLCARSGTLNDS